jgi:chemotaxis protein methyltransferase CheR
MQVTQEDLPAVSRLVDELCGVVLDATKGYLIESRLSRLAEAAGCATFREFSQKARLPANAAIRNEIIDAITTQETLFFRDDSPFEALRYRVLPDLIDAKNRTRCPKRLRFWSAACSTGQEPYSIAMALCEMIPDILSWDVTIMGTDISNSAIRQASRGHYGKYEIQRGMKPQLLARYFTEEQGGWKVKDHLRSLVMFERRNLLEPFADVGTFDVIFCRNVAIYFDAPARRSLFHRLAERLAPDGHLFTGSAECLTDLGPQFVPQHHCRAVYYQPNKQPPTGACGPIVPVVRKVEASRPAMPARML